MAVLTTFIVEDNPLILDTLVSTLQELTPVQVVGSAADEARAMAWLDDPSHGCELLIVDIFLKSGSGLGVLRRTAGRTRAQKRSVGRAPKFEIVPELRAVLFVQARDHHLDHDDLRRLVLYGAIIAAIKVMLVDGLRSRQPIRSDRQFDRLEYCRLPGVVVA